MQSLLMVCVMVGLAKAQPSVEVEWTWGPVLPMAQSAVGTVAIGRDIVIVGGTYWVNSRDGVPTKIWSDKVWKLNTETMKWTSLRDYPLPLGYPLVVADTKRIWVIGGASEKRTHSKIHVLDVSQTNADWKPGPPLPVPRMGGKGGIADGMIYVAAGTELRETQSTPAMDLLRLDTRNLKHGWQHVSNIPGPHIEWRSGTISDGTLYLFGGLMTPDPVVPRSPDKVVRATHNMATLTPRSESCAFNIASHRWKNLRPLPVPMGSGGCTGIDDHRILITGGLALAIAKNRLSDHKIRTYLSNECLLYDTKKDQYETLTSSLRLSVLDHGSAIIGGTVYVIGGEDSTWKTRTDLVQIGQLR